MKLIKVQPLLQLSVKIHDVTYSSDSCHYVVTQLPQGLCVVKLNGATVSHALVDTAIKQTRFDLDSEGAVYLVG